MMTQMYSNVGQELMSMATETEHGSAGRMPTSVEKVRLLNICSSILSSRSSIARAVSQSVCPTSDVQTKMFLVVL
jgi:hypothetical protein